MILFAYLLPILLLFCGFKFSKLKGVTLLFLFYFWIIAGFNTGLKTPDYENYATFYENVFYNVVYDTVDPEWGYIGLNFLFGYLGFSYQEFRIIFNALYAILLIKAAIRLTPYRNYTLALFLIWPFLGFVSGQRQAMASVIICWGIPFLLDESKRGSIKYILCVLAAASIHNSTLFYIILLFARHPLTKKQLKRLFMSVTLLTLFMYFSTSLGAITALFANPKITMWLDRSAGSDVLNFKGFIFLLFTTIVLVYISVKQGDILLKKAGKDSIYSKRIVLYKNVSIFMLFVIPGYAVAGIFQRLVVGMLLINYAIFSEFSCCSQINNKERVNYRVKTIVVIVLLALSYILGGNNVFAALTDNIFFN